MIKNRLYQNQFYLLGFISVVTFKFAMLPSYLSESSGINSFYTMIIMMIIELMMLLIIYGIISKISLVKMEIPKILKDVLLGLIFISLSFKLLVFILEGTNYVSNYVFESSPIWFCLIPTIVLVLYMSYKGITNIAKVAEITFWFLAFAFLFNILFATIDIDFAKIINSTINSNIAVGADKHLAWFGDFTPFLLTTIVRPKKVSVLAVFATIAVILCPVLLMIGFVGIYGEAGALIEYAFSKLAVYNQFSQIIGTFDIPTIIAFLMSMIIKFSIITFALIDILEYFFKRRGIITVLIGVFLVVMIVFVFKNMQLAYEYATSFFRYVVAAIEYLVPIFVYIFMRVFKADNVSVGSRLEKVQNA